MGRKGIFFERNSHYARIADVHLKTRITNRFAFEGGLIRAKAKKTKKEPKHIMKKRLLRGIAVAAMTGIVLTAHAQDATTDQSQYPTILEQPVDQCLPVGSPATFSVVATNVDSYQWYKNNTAI